MAIERERELSRYETHGAEIYYRNTRSESRVEGRMSRHVRHAYHWLAVNGGVLAVATVVAAAERHILDATLSKELSALGSTLVLYAIVFSACAFNLRGRRVLSPHKAGSHSSPIAWYSVLAHPLGSAFERYAHSAMARASTMELMPLSSPMHGIANGTTTNWAAAVGPASTMFDGTLWWLELMSRLLVFEVLFDGVFYVAHRLVHSVPSVYVAVHKLHHAHTHDVRLLSSLQMTAADVVLTHTLPVLAALALVPLAPGLELSLAKTYLLFQELYGHAGVEHKGRCFGPAPFLMRALGIELCAADHRRHHIKASVNFSKRLALWDKLLGTWDSGEQARHEAKGLRSWGESR